MDNESNKIKQNNYKILYSKLNDALKQKFYFESVMIEHNIIEDRVLSILLHSKAKVTINVNKSMLGVKLNSLTTQINKKDNIIAKYVDMNLIDDVKEWKNYRNILVHKACTFYDEEKASECAKKGKELSRKLDSCASKIKKEMNKKK